MEYIEYSRLLFKEFALVGGILAGFSFSVAFQLLTRESGTRIIYTNLVLFFSAAISLITSIIGTGLLFIASRELQGESGTGVPDLTLYHYLENIAGWSFIVGIFLFVAGIGSSGWLKSRKFGLFSTFLSVVFLLIVGISFVLFGIMT